MRLIDNVVDNAKKKVKRCKIEIDKCIMTIGEDAITYYRMDGNILVFVLPDNPSEDTKKVPHKPTCVPTCEYSSHSNYYQYFNPPDAPNFLHPKTIEELRPESPFIARRHVDNSLCFMDIDRRVFVFSEDEAALWMALVVEVCREYYEEGVDNPWNQPDIRKILEKYGRSRWIACYKNFDAFIKCHRPGPPISQRREGARWQRFEEEEEERIRWYKDKTKIKRRK